MAKRDVAEHPLAEESDEDSGALGPTSDPRQPVAAAHGNFSSPGNTDSDDSGEAVGTANSSGMLKSMLDSTPAEPLLVPSSSSSADFPVADWDRYEFLGVLGHGGMGTVYKARDRRILRLVALKFISGAGERIKQRFAQEARMQARLDHPGICKVLEVGEVEGKSYIAMQYVNGPSLYKAKGQLSLREKVQIIKETAETLHLAHELGIIHRDIKPAKVSSSQR